MAQPATSSVDRRWMVLVVVAIAQLMVVLGLILGGVLTQYLSWRWKGTRFRWPCPAAHR